MRRFLIIVALAAILGAGSSTNTVAYAQGQPADIAGALSRLQNNPRYRGRILGTHIMRDGSRYLYEVRILRPDDRVVLVYIDPETGGVVGDSERRRMVGPDRNDRPPPREGLGFGERRPRGRPFREFGGERERERGRGRGRDRDFRRGFR